MKRDEHYQLLVNMSNGWKMSSKPVSFCKIFLRNKLLYANFQHVCNTSAKKYIDPMKALRGVDFTEHALSTIINEYTSQIKRGIN